MHLEEGVLEALLDGELGIAEASETRRHIETCAECRAQLEELRQDDMRLSDALRWLDHPAPPLSLATIVTRASRPRLPLRWAAGVALLLTAAGAAYALPGSPIRRWVDRIIGRRDAIPTERSAAAAGIAVVPGPHFSIVFTAPRQPSIVTIALTDGATIDARRLRGDATFSAEIDRLTIEVGELATSFEITIPRSAPRVAIFVGNQRVFLKDGTRISTETRPDARGYYILRLVR